MKRKIVVAVSGLILVIAVLAGVKALQIKALIDAGKTATVPSETISATEVKEQTWESVLPAVGSITAVQGGELRSELGGTGPQIAVPAGGPAAKGQAPRRPATPAAETAL